jgi:hypothetical protein
MLPAGIYQIRLAARDNKTGALGTVSRYLEVPDLSSGHLAASSLILGAVPEGAIKAPSLAPIPGNRRVSRKEDLRYGVEIYNAKLKDGKPHVKVAVAISQNGKVVYQAPEEPVQAAADGSGHLVKVGQVGLAKVNPGRYVMTMIITDPLADKRSQTITRSQDFMVIR